jgi:hypothetical protein
VHAAVLRRELQDGAVLQPLLYTALANFPHDADVLIAGCRLVDRLAFNGMPRPKQ